MAENRQLDGPPDPLDLLKQVAQAREKIISGEMEFAVARYRFSLPLQGTNRVRVKAVFDGEHRRFESFDREYAYVMMDLTPPRLPMPKYRSWGWTRRRPSERDS